MASNADDLGSWDLLLCVAWGKCLGQSHRLDTKRFWEFSTIQAGRLESSSAQMELGPWYTAG